ncbi:MAG: ABC transporter permease [Saccharofermentans sp.]|nr:ABC transporter permease [Saccharofermentans sp.]
MSNLKARIRVMPIHAIIMCIAAFLSLASIFVPIFELFVQYQKRNVYSLLTLLTRPRVFVSLMRGGSVDLNFQMFGIVVFIVTIIISVAALTLALGFQLYSNNRKTKRWGCISVAVLLIARIGVHFYTLSNFITDEMMNANKLNPQRLYVVQNTWGNLLVIICFIGIVAAIYGALGLQMHMKFLSYPYMAWVVIFTILPLFLILFRAFFMNVNGGYQFTLEGFKTLFGNKTVTASFYGKNLTLQENFSVFLRSLDYAAWTTVGCLILGYPLAYILADRTKRMHKTSSKLLLLFVLPMWMNTMLRTYAWRAFFSKLGVLNTFLMYVGLMKDPIDYLGNPIIADIITKVVMVNDFLPFMILPIYSVLVKIDSSLSQAAADLGATRVQCFTKVIFPLSLPGVISGVQMVFMPSMTFYMIPDIISEGSRTTIGNTVQSFILNESKSAQQAGNVLSLLLLIFVLITMGILRNQDKEASGNGGMIL